VLRVIFLQLSFFSKYDPELCCSFGYKTVLQKLHLKYALDIDRRILVMILDFSITQFRHRHRSHRHSKRMKMTSTDDTLSHGDEWIVKLLQLQST